MAGGKKRRAPIIDPPGRPPAIADTERAGPEHLLVSRNGNAMANIILYVAGGTPAGPDRHPALRDFALVNRGKGQSKAAHLAQVTGLVDEAMAAGATHLLVPRQQADWLGKHPWLVDYFATEHELAEAGAELGVLITLRPRAPSVFAGLVSGWEIIPGEGISLMARRPLLDPEVILRPTVPPRGALRGRLVITAAGIRTLRLGLEVIPVEGQTTRERQVVLSLARPGYLFHDVSFVEATFRPDGAVQLELDLALETGEQLERIALRLVEEDNWRMHPDFPGGKSFALPATAPAGARLALRELALEPVGNVRQGVPHGTVRGTQPSPYRRSPQQPRDAVIFSSWVPESGLILGDYFVDLLRRWHGDSKIFVGINHGSSPCWADRLRASGLDVTIQMAAPTLTMPSDPTGFVAALDAYRQHEEAFNLVWFGHNKGGDHLGDIRYAAARWTIERMFWSRRAEIEHHFDDPVIGLYAPHYLMMTPNHRRQTDALLRMYQASCAPLGVMALSTHFVMRDESVRDFCARVDRRFFRFGPELFGGDRFFVEMAITDVPIMQGYEPYIEPGLGGTTGQPKMDGVVSIHNDWRQNHAVVGIELEKWRRDPTGFRTRHVQLKKVK